MTVTFTQEHIEAFHENERAVIHLLFREHFMNMVRYASQLINNPAEAREIVLCTFMKLITLRHNFNAPADIRAFLLVTIRNNCYDVLSTAHLIKPDRGDVLYITDLVPLSSITDHDSFAETIITLYDSIQGLPPRLYGLVSRLLYNKATVEEVAGELNIPIKQALTERNMALTQIKEQLIAAAF